MTLSQFGPNAARVVFSFLEYEKCWLTANGGGGWWAVKISLHAVRRNDLKSGMNGTFFFLNQITIGWNVK